MLATQRALQPGDVAVSIERPLFCITSAAIWFTAPLWEKGRFGRLTLTNFDAVIEP